MKLEKLVENFPFLSYGKYLDKEYLGIIQNCDNQVINMYIYNMITLDDLKEKFLQMGDIWWWESNRQLPINIFLKDQFKIFKPYLRTFAKKEFTLLAGPSVCLDDLITKRVKRRQITLVKNI